MKSFGACLGAGRKGLDLNACIVVIKLSVNRQTLGHQQVADRVAQRRLPAVAYMQRTGWVGRYKLDHGARITDRRFDTELPSRSQHFPHGFLLGRRLEPEVDKAGSGDVDGLHPVLESRVGQQDGPQRFSHLSRIQLEPSGQLHGSGAGKVAVGSNLGGLQSGFFTRTRRKLFQAYSQRCKQIIFNQKHRQILRLPTVPKF